jgi:hypothetical protein
VSNLSPESRAILDAAGEPAGPSEAERSRMKRTLLAHGATLVGTGVAAGAMATGGVATAATGAVATKLVVAVLVVAGATGTTVWGVHSLRRDAAERRQVPIAQQTAPPDRTSLATPSLPKPPVIDEPAQVSEAPPVAPTHAAPMSTSTRRVRVQAPAPAMAASSTPTLAAELVEIRAAQALLLRGDALGALGALDRYDSRFPNGVMREERRSLRVGALCALGRRAEARLEAQRLLTESPRSPQAARVRGSCVGDDR